MSYVLPCPSWVAILGAQPRPAVVGRRVLLGAGDPGARVPLYGVVATMSSHPLGITVDWSNLAPLR